MKDAKQYSAIWKRKSKAFKECLMGFRCVCLCVCVCVCVCVCAMDDGKCSPGYSVTVCVVLESLW